MFESLVDASSFSVSTWIDAESSLTGENALIGFTISLLLSVLESGELIKSFSFSSRFTG